MRLQLVPAPGRHDVLELPWDQPLDVWHSDRLVVAARGIGRHVVRFVESGDVVLALKELPERLAEREYRILRALTVAGLRSVDPVGVVTGRRSASGEPLEGVIMTRYLEFSLPYRLVFARKPIPALVSRLLDALVELLVQLHLAGIFWGDCSLSNTLFRRDAGALAAYLVDTETAEKHERLSDGQRRHDVEIAAENLIGELLDVEAELGEQLADDPFALSEELHERYERLWTELNAEEVLGPADRARIEERLRRVNELGYDVDEVEIVETDGGFRFRVRPKAGDPGHHRRRLMRLTGLEAQENQARRLLSDIWEHRARLEREGRPPVSDAAVAGSWLTEIFEPTIAAVPAELWTKRAAAEVFHELLEHRWFLSEQANREISHAEAVPSYIENVLRAAPDERAVVIEPEPETDAV
jgi:hypothetical protein